MKKVIDFLKSVWNWVRLDGMLHIVVCMVLTVVFTALFKLIVPLWTATLIACVCTMAIGFAKEIWDRCSKKGTAEWHDIICDAIGVALAVITIVILAL